MVNFKSIIIDCILIGSKFQIIVNVMLVFPSRTCIIFIKGIFTVTSLSTFSTIGLYSSDFNCFLQLACINLLDVTTSKNIVLVYCLFIQNFGNHVQIWVDDVGKEFKRRSSFWLVQHFCTYKNIGSECFEPENYFIDHLSSFFVGEFFEQNNLGIRFFVAWV